MSASPFAINAPVTTNQIQDIVGAKTFTTSLTVGSGGTALTLIAVYDVDITPGSVSANSTLSTTVGGVTGLNTGDRLVVNPPGSVAGVGYVGARSTAVNTLALRFQNFTGTPKTPPAGIYRVLAYR